MKRHTLLIKSLSQPCEAVIARVALLSGPFDFFVLLVSQYIKVVW